MSFDLFLTHFRHGETAELNKAAIDEILGPHAVRREPTVMRLEFSDGGQAEVYLGDASDNTTVMFTHFGGEACFEAIYQLAARTQSLILWPDVGPSEAMADPATLQHLPSNYLEEHGTPPLVRSGRDLMEPISR